MDENSVYQTECEVLADDDPLPLVSADRRSCVIMTGRYCRQLVFRVSSERLRAWALRIRATGGREGNTRPAEAVGSCLQAPIQRKHVNDIRSPTGYPIRSSDRLH
jgi:hypothetical protein